MGWARRLGRRVRYHADATPWCGLCIGHVIASTLPKERLPNNILSALEWAKFGRSLPGPAIGAIGVKRRRGGGHVFLYAGESPDGSLVYALGGNQSDRINVIPIRKREIFAWRWPSTAPSPSGGKVVISGGRTQSRLARLRSRLRSRLT
jgi:uncharacterized protein (TIGR02594 family)